MSKDIAITTENLSFCYEDNNEIIRNIDLTLYSGETTALVGENGAGKTTLGKLLTGILKPSGGEITIFGDDTGRLSLSDIGQKIGYCFQNPDIQLFASSVEEEICFGLKYRGFSDEYIETVKEELLKLFEIDHLRNAFPLNLSRGEKRRVVLAACLALNPSYLILDEPTAGLDADRIIILNNVLDKLSKKGIGILIISHNEDFIQTNSDRILRLYKGTITDDCRI